MAYVIPLYGQNIYTAAAMAGVSVDELSKKISDSESTYKKAKDIEWAIAKLGKDEEWYETTMKKVEAIRLTLPDDIDYKEKTKRLYGWIAQEVLNVYSDIPMEMDMEYSKAYSIELILTDPDGYLRVINWD